MGLPTSKPDMPAAWSGRFVQHGDFAATLKKRREMLGSPAMPRNAGNRRTASKAAMLDALEKLGAEW